MSARTTVSMLSRRSVAPRAASCLQRPVILFDVEGTLVDAVPATLRCWRETLAEFGHAPATGALERMSGLDGADMLKHLLSGVTEEEVRRLIDSQGRRYRSRYLSDVKPFPHACPLFEKLRSVGKVVGIATDCSRDELDHYLDLAGVRGMADAMTCGDDAKQGKPHPDLLRLVLKRLRARGSDAVMIGDTPFDALAARSAHADAVGLLTGTFVPDDFIKVGACATFRDLEVLMTAFRKAAS